MVALVAALAALAVAGRLVFAPIPNVVATTDIVLITGYAVGARARLRGRRAGRGGLQLWLGQGPWTPWQMAGWGLVGFGGAALGAVTGGASAGSASPLACGLAGFAYGALLDLSVMVTYGGEQSLDRYLAISARGMPFNVAHAAGNVVLALAAGPALVRMISRYRSGSSSSGARRRAVRARRCRRRAAGAPASPAALGARARGSWPCRCRPGRRRRSAWLERAQNPDGGFGASRRRRRRARRSRAGRCSGSRAPGATRSTFGRAGPIADRLPALAGRRPALDRRPRADDPGARGGRRQPAAVRRPRPGGGASPPTLAQRLVRGTGEPDRVRDPRPARRRAPSRPRSRALGRLAARRPERRRRLGLSAERRQRPGQHRRGAPGPGRRRRRPAPSDAPGRRLPAPRTASATAASRWQAGGPRTPSRPRGRSRAWSRRASSPPRCGSTATLRSTTSPARQAGDGHYRYSASSDQTPVWVTGQALLAVRAQGVPACARWPGRCATGGRRGTRAAGRSGSDARSAGRPSDQPDSPPATVSHGRRRLRATGSTHRRLGRVAERARSSPGRLRPCGSAHRPAPRTSCDWASRSAPRWTPRRGAGLLTALAHGRLCRRRRLASLALALAAGFLWYRRRPGRRAAATGYRCRRWTSRPRFAPGAPTRPSGPSPVPTEVLDELLELARWAPNHHLTNPWRFRVVGPRALERLKEAAGPEAAAKLDRAPTLVVCSCVLGGDPVQDEEDLHATACAAYIVLLAAHARGLAGYWRTPAVLRTDAGRAAVGLARRRAVRRPDPPRPSRSRSKAARPSARRSADDRHLPRLIPAMLSRCRRTRGAERRSASTWS